MRFNLGVVEMTDEQRLQLAQVLDNRVHHRLANRNEARDFVLKHGARWASDLTIEFQNLTGDTDEFDEDDLL